MFEKHLWKSDILSKDPGHQPTTWFLHKSNIGRKWANCYFQRLTATATAKYLHPNSRFFLLFPIFLRLLISQVVWQLVR